MTDLPTRDEILEWIRENPQKAGKREIARAFDLKGADRIELKRLLRKMQDAGEIEGRRRHARPAGSLPPVTILRVTGTDPDGELLAQPEHWEGDGPPPVVLLTARRNDPAMGPGDRVLAKIGPVERDGKTHTARPITKIAAAARRMLGVFEAGDHGGRLVPVEKGAAKEWVIPPGDTGGAQNGELVEAEGLDHPRRGLPRGRIVERHGDPRAPRQFSLIAMVEHQIALAFDEEALHEARAARPIEDPGEREDLRDLPLITIDPADARDHDDAICAAPDDDRRNPGGHVVWVAIADVAHYVTPGGALDHEARARGNSTYFTDRVAPMLPEELSADLCSLHVGVDRPCMAVRMVLDAQGNKIAHRFTRGLMRSAASLNYRSVQDAHDGQPTALSPAIVQDVLAPLYRAWEATTEASKRRQPLDLDLPERRIELSEAGDVSSIAYRERLDAHRLIEEFMVLANVSAAETLEAAGAKLLYRVHEEPDPAKLDALRETVSSAGLTLARGQVLKTRHLNDLLVAARGTDDAEVIAMSVLRAQTQAYYSPRNLAHFGLNLARYAHFTSPIRRYADLVVHRALIGALKLGPDGQNEAEVGQLVATAEHISRTERRSMEAERDTNDRYVAAFMADRTGGEFTGRIAGVSRAGVFVRLDETGADGLVPISSLGSDYFHHDRDRQTLTGERTGRVLELGLKVTVRLVEATPITGGLILELLSVEGSHLQRGHARRLDSARRKSSKPRFRRSRRPRRQDRGR